MHLADTFIQSDLQCIQVTVFFTFYQLLLSLGIEPTILALLAPCSTIWATGKHFFTNIFQTFKQVICELNSDVVARPNSSTLYTREHINMNH